MLIRDIETQQPKTVRPDCTLQNAALIMRQMDVGSLPVCDGEKLVGMVTDRDIAIRGVAVGLNPGTTPVQDIMTRRIIYCHEEQEVEEVARLMEEKQIRRVPVLDNNKKLKGILSLGDLAVRGHNMTMAGEVLERVSEPTHK